MERAYRQFTRASGALISLLGVALVVVTIGRGGGPLALGVICGICLALFGAGRVLLARDGA
ncbi:MAG: hypothetical protein WD844_14020 [Thermoleophilaceae bacterium]